MQEIKYPTDTTYFIAYTNSRVCAWGSVNPDQEMSSGQPNLYQTTNETQWLAELQNFYVVWGYQFYNLETAETYKIMINNYYDSDVAEVKYAEYNNPTFWYIEGDFTEATEDEPESFQVYPN
jgi:hypothetical protein